MNTKPYGQSTEPRFWIVGKGLPPLWRWSWPGPGSLQRWERYFPSWDPLMTDRPFDNSKWMLGIAFVTVTTSFLGNYAGGLTKYANIEAQASMVPAIQRTLSEHDRMLVIHDRDLQQIRETLGIGRTERLQFQRDVLELLRKQSDDIATLKAELQAATRNRRP